jgi:hypothetical protein
MLPSAEPSWFSIIPIISQEEFWSNQHNLSVEQEYTAIVAHIFMPYKKRKEEEKRV